MKNINWNPEKNLKLQAERQISFEVMEKYI
jgi:hypothetical protein